MSRSRIALVAVATALVMLAAGCGGRIQPGSTYSGDGTYYTSYPATGWGGNCMRGGSQEIGVLYAAMNDADDEGARMCGAWVQATGPNGTVTVQIVDRCPECQPGDIDFSPEAFDHLAPRVQGRVPISWHLVSPDPMGPIALVVKDGSNAWWIGIQVRNHRNLVQSVEAQVNGSWRALVRQSYDFFLADQGLGDGPFTVRVTDIYGQQLVVSGVTLSAGALQTTTQQFAVH